MPYTLTARDSSRPDEDAQRWMAQVNNIEGHPGQVVETEYEDMNRADATAAIEALEADVLANPAKYFGG